MGGVQQQSFLMEPRWMNKAIDTIKCACDDVVFVIGGGNGHLASLLCENARIMLVEPDEQISRYLYTLELYHTMVINSQPHIVMGDIPFDKILCLQPTLVSENLFWAMLRVPFDKAVIMIPDDVQFLLRSHSMLGVLLRASYDVELLQNVPKNSFSPPLQVASRLALFEPKAKPDPLASSLQLLIRESGTLRGLLTRSCREFFGYTLAEAQEAVRLLDVSLLKKAFWDIDESEFKNILAWLRLG